MQKQKEGFSGERIIILPREVVESQRNDPLVSSLYISDIGYYPHAVNHFRERKEPIAENVLLYCMVGKGHYRLDGEEYAVEKNQYVILPAGKPHAYWSDAEEPWTIYWIHFSGEHSRFYIENATTPQNVRPGLTSRISDRNNIFEEIFYTIDAGYSQENLRYASSLLHYYLGSMRYLQQYRSSESRQRRQTIETLSEAAIHFMTENLEGNLTLDDIAHYLGYSVSYFAASFKKQTGESPLSCYNRLKIERACQLLKETDMHINQICFKVGIEDSYYFSRLFQKKLGMSPTQYRMQL